MWKKYTYILIYLLNFIWKYKVLWIKHIKLLKFLKNSIYGFQNIIFIRTKNY